MKIYQVVNSTDGTRSEAFSAPSLSSMASSLAKTVADRPAVAEFYVLVLLEDADSVPFVSRAPMMRVQTVIDNFGDK